jgi:predicted Zn-dependent protease with MMP-like domain
VSALKATRGLIDRDGFGDMVIQAMKELPPAFRRKMKNIEIVIEDLPGRDLLLELGITSPKNLLGIYQGVPLTSRHAFYGNVLPDRIVLFKESIEFKAISKRNLKPVIRDVLLHEIGHYFGLDEKELDLSD